MLRNLLVTIFCVLFLLSCTEKKPSKKKLTDEQETIDYLKTEFRIKPDVKRIDSFYLKELIVAKRSLDPDSLISYQVKTYRYAPLNLDFIEYRNDFKYKDGDYKDIYAIKFIRNYKTGKIYYDYINWDAGLIVEDYCAYSRIDINRAGKEVSEKDRKIYAKIDGKNLYGENEIGISQRKIGLESLLNNEFRFKKLAKSSMDSLFNYYDRECYNTISDTEIFSVEGLMKCFSSQVKEINNRKYTYGDELTYLKRQIELLLVRRNRNDTLNNFQWIYSGGHRLRERAVSIRGNDKFGYYYFIDEKDFCF